MKRHRVHIVLDIYAENRFDALQKAHAVIQSGNYKEQFAYHFVEKDKKSNGWLGTIKDQLLGK